MCRCNPKVNLVGVLLVCTAFTVAIRGDEFAATAARPNIVFILADDLGYGDLGVTGHPHDVTPHLDRLAAEGTRFTQFYVSHCVCSPTRASAITGHYPSRWRIHSYLAWLDLNKQRNMPDWLDVTAPSLPRTLQRAGYRTAHFGKWHLGGGSGRIFRGRAINSADAPDVAAYGFHRARATVGNGPTWKNAEPVAEPHDVYPLEDEGWLTWSSRAIVDSGIRFLHEHRADHSEQPFMLNLWLKDPHVPLRPTAAMREPFQHLDEPLQTYCAVLRYMDAQIGRFLEELEALELAQDTLVLFTSDNGAVVSTGGSNGPLRGWKWHLHEGGIRVPLIARWPDRIPAGRVDTDSLLGVVDLFPTLCRLANAAAPDNFQPDGVDISQALLGQTFQRAQPLCWYHPSPRNPTPELAVRDGRWKLLIDRDGSHAELYDLQRDAGETRNLADQHPSLVARLKQTACAFQDTLPPWGDD